MNKPLFLSPDMRDQQSASLNFARPLAGAQVPDRNSESRTPEFLDVQGPLLRAASMAEQLALAQDRESVAWIIALCGWLLVAAMLALL